ncbi:hypothetical protein Hanom_Chr07g00613241 [Helianthus anomalus]
MFTGKQVLKMVYPPARCLCKIPMRKFDLDKIRGIGYWYYDGKTGEAVITKKKMIEEILRILDPVWLINLKMEHLKVLRRLPLHYNKEDHPLADHFIKVVQFCVKNQVCAGSDYSKR